MASRWAGGPPRIHKDSLAETNPSQDWENSKTSRTNLPLDPIKSQAINFCSVCRDGGFFLPPLSHQAANSLIIYILPLALRSQPSGPCNRNVPKKTKKNEPKMWWKNCLWRQLIWKFNQLNSFEWKKRCLEGENLETKGNENEKPNRLRQ